MNQMNMDIARGSRGTAPWLMPPGIALADADAPLLKDIPVAELGIRRLLGAADIAGIAQLRGEIDLAAAASADPHFAHREKKETNWAWSMPLSFTAMS